MDYSRDIIGLWEGVLKKNLLLYKNSTCNLQLWDFFVYSVIFLQKNLHISNLCGNFAAILQFNLIRNQNKQ